jgi:nitrogen fixation protein NifU and related proteins
VSAFGDDRAAQLEFILDHYQNPRNHGALPDADAHVEGGNPGCGDRVTIFLKVRDGKIDQISFEGEGCTISQAAASLLTEHAQGLTTAEAQDLDYSFLVDELGEEVVKMRPRCATLGLDTLKAALEEYRRRQVRGEV